MLLRRRQQGNLRKLQIFDHLIDFASNDYLGLSRSTLLKDNILHLGSTGSRLLTGNSKYAQDLEESIAGFHGYATGTLFNCGYMANLGLISSIAKENDTIIFDSQIHASMRDGIRLSRAKGYPFRHNDLEHLEARLKTHRGFICIESIYSTDGSIAPLKEICALAKQYNAKLIVDEAHAVGVFGSQGKGLLTEPVFAKIVTFGKALGVHGAIVLGSSSLQQTLINFARPYIYTTALPHYALAAIKSSYELFPHMEEERKHLQQLICQLNLSSTTIQPLKIKGNSAVKKASEKLRAAGFDVRPLMSPTVQQGHESLRICLHAFNTNKELKGLQKCLEF